MILAVTHQLAEFRAVSDPQESDDLPHATTGIRSFSVSLSHQRITGAHSPTWTDHTAGRVGKQAYGLMAKHRLLARRYSERNCDKLPATIFHPNE